MNSLSVEEIQTILDALEIRLLVLDETAKTIHHEETRRCLIEKRKQTENVYAKLELAQEDAAIVKW